MDKTNAIRYCDKAKIPYRCYTYASEGVALDAKEVSRRIAQPSEWVYKTLVAIGQSQTIYVLVINGADELDLKKAAVFLHEKSIDLIPVSQLLKTTGYVRGGCSPLGMKKPFVTLFDKKVEHLDKMIVSGGKIGLQIELKPQHLISVVSGQIADLIKLKQTE